MNSDPRPLDTPDTVTPLPPRLRELAWSFPCLSHLRAELQSVEALATWAYSFASHGEDLAARFVLGVWNPEVPEAWGVGRFDVHDAMGTWSPTNRDAFVAWARAPWWC